jgi:hypothetical protein
VQNTKPTTDRAARPTDAFLNMTKSPKEREDGKWKTLASFLNMRLLRVVLVETGYPSTLVMLEWVT